MAKDYQDGTNWTKQDDTINEWWTDGETKRVVGSKGGSHKHPDNVRIPSFTPAERRRFQQLLATGDFCDVSREFHPYGSSIDGNFDSEWDTPNYTTWRGHHIKARGDASTIF